jgi:SAM-dependent methyltransferase
MNTLQPIETNQDAQQIKAEVKKFYGQVALSNSAAGCCDTGGCCGIELDIKFAEDYSQLDGYVPEADLGLGCGLPTQFAQIQAGETVLDLGSGAGNDAFVARRLVGETGRVLGVDFTGEMVKKARDNARRLGYDNVEFKLGDIENLPIEADSIDLIVSNCVLNLVPDKPRAFAEMFRVLKPGGRFCVSDIVLEGELPARLRSVVSLYAGCVSGAVPKADYLDFARQAGFSDLIEFRLQPLHVPQEALARHLSEAEATALLPAAIQLYSLTLGGQKGD